ACAIGFAVAASGWAADRTEASIRARRNYWAFQPPQRAEVPVTRNPWVRTPVDAFLLQAMQAKGLTPSRPLDRERLIRRLTLDLTGLPPTPGDVDLFLLDKSPNAYEKLVDRLLASPHYGERWALRWLDVVRYADTNGYELDVFRPQAWRYRDYVVKSFNDDKPYDRFVKEQIAGDELWPGNHEALIATGFNRAGPIHLVSGNQDEELNREQVLTEMSGAIGSTFLGLTVGCAKCHNHKFDPILQADYYSLQAIFASTAYQDIDIATPGDKAAYKQAKRDYDARLKPIEDAIAVIEKPYRATLREQKMARLDAPHRAALDTPKEKRMPEERTLAKEAESQLSPTWDEVLAIIPAPEKQRRAELRRQMHDIERTEPDPPPAAYAVADMDTAPPSYILKVGDPKHKLAQVRPALLTVLTEPGASFPQGPAGRRAALANWIAAPENPLTARVMVNRIWQFRMGAGIVSTPNDFGVMGQRPANKALLDWLATEFIARNWSVKAIDRLLVTSSAYMQEAAGSPANARIDPDNKLYWRANRRRLEGEIVRDSILSVAGDLNPRLGGKPVRVPIEKEVYDLIFSEFEPDNLWPVPKDKNEYRRRSLYLLNKRNVRLPLLANFDQPDEMTSCPVRPVSTHALQALTLMNSGFMQEQSQILAARLRRECEDGSGCEVRRAYKLALARLPKPAEMSMARAFFKRGGLLEDFCLAMLNRNEFIYEP
ncbi:MAG: DUF1549 and DUF1553 domain-containing protein, partial [Bryobacteraceae bacterium]